MQLIGRSFDLLIFSLTNLDEIYVIHRFFLLIAKLKMFIMIIHVVNRNKII